MDYNLSKKEGTLNRIGVKGLHIAANYGRVVAPLQRLPCQKTKPKGLLLHFLVVVLAYSCIAIIDACACDDWTYTSVNLI